MSYVLPPDVRLHTDLNRPQRELSLLHPIARDRWERLRIRLTHAGFDCLVNETWRSTERQGWLYGQGRSVAEVCAKGLPDTYARKGNIVTNSWSAANSAHGWTIKEDTGGLVPQACAVDVVPVGEDGKPWTKDDPWDDWYRFVSSAEIFKLGLVHFHKPGKKPWDLPHLQLAEWSDSLKRPVFGD